MKRLTPFFLLLLTLCFSTCGNTDDDDMNPPNNPNAKNFLALGDSYTIGESVAASERWPERLVAALADSGVLFNQPEIIATTGWTTSELLAGIANREDELLEEYDLVSLLIGVNNQFRGQSLDTYRDEFTELLDYAISKSANGRFNVFVVSIPDYAFTPFGGGNPTISAGVDEFNEAARQICAMMDIPFLNITPISRLGLEQPELVADDDLHPSGEQYRRWVQEVILAGALVVCR